jgi:citrate lyase subunit beta/citryl-CoA lyase
VGTVNPSLRGPAAAARTLLFVPGTAPARFDKAVVSGADLVVVDLEDAVAEHDKSSARDEVVTWLGAGGRAAVRINAFDAAHHRADVAALVGLPGLVAVILPMADNYESLASLHEQFGSDVELVPLVETAAGVARAAEVASAPGVVRLAFGHLDFALDIDADTDSESMLLARSTLVVASRAAGRAGPVDGVTTLLDDPGAAGTDAVRARRLGFTGKLCIHPRQVEPVNTAMSPSDAEVAWARRVLDSRAEGSASRLDGQMIDAPVLAKAEAIVSRTRRNHD